MGEEVWERVDSYITGALHEPDPVLVGALERCAAAKLPPIQVSAAQGKFLHLLARIQGARTVLEIGTLGAYSSIWLARALPQDGRLISLEVNPAHAEVARANIEAAGLSAIVEVRLGRAIDSLPVLEEQSLGPFDLVFIDADKSSNADYFTWALRLTHPGSVIVVDNVVRGGAVVDETTDDADVRGVRRLFELVGSEKRVSATALQTVGQKSYDGFLVARVER
jgi:predicted O-methyltransferase YrrM